MCHIVDLIYTCSLNCPHYDNETVAVYRWVHLVCALYVPGVAFSNVDKLSGVTLFEMSYTKWGAKVRLCLSITLYLSLSVCLSVCLCCVLTTMSQSAHVVG